MSVSQERTHRMEGFPPKEQREELGGEGAADGRKTEARVTVSIYATRFLLAGGHPDRVHPRWGSSRQ